MRPQLRPELDCIYTADASALLPTWRAGCVDLLVTDPPYGNGNVGYGVAKRRIAGDENPLVGLRAVAASYRLLKPNATAYIFCGPSHIAFLEHFFLRYSQFRIRELLVWNKGQIGFGSVFRRMHETIMVLEKGTPRYRAQMPTVLTVRRADTTLHPHAKPVELLQRLIAASSDPEDVVLDPFAGSGSTAVAAMGLQRRFVGIEIDETHAANARTRLRQEAVRSQEAA